MNAEIKTVNISPYDIAVHDARHSGLQQLIINDTFEVLDILKALPGLQNPVNNLVYGIDIIRWLDKSAGRNVHLCFIEENIYFILLKFDTQNDGGLILIMSEKVQSLIDLFSQMQAIPCQQDILLWLIDN